MNTLALALGWCLVAAYVLATVHVARTAVVARRNGDRWWCVGFVTASVLMAVYTAQLARVLWEASS